MSQPVIVTYSPPPKLVAAFPFAMKDVDMVLKAIDMQLSWMRLGWGNLSLFER